MYLEPVACAISMPPDNGLRLHDGECLSPVRPDPGQQDPEQSVAFLEMGTFRRALQNGDLLPQCEVLEGQLSVASQGGDDGSEQR